MNKKKLKLLKLISEYTKNLEKNSEIIKYLYNHTELFEELTMMDFNEELFRYFAGKITYTSRELNKLYLILDNKTKEDLNYIKLTEE